MAVAPRNTLEQWATEWAWIDLNLLPGPPQLRGLHLRRQQIAPLSLGLTRLCDNVSLCEMQLLMFGMFWDFSKGQHSVRKELFEFTCLRDLAPKNASCLNCF